MQFAQILLSDEQALQTRLALDLILQDPERFVITEEERADYQRLAVFFGHVASNPTQFAPRGDMATTVKSIVRRAKGPAQPQSRKNKRKARQERRAGFHKARRAERREFAKLYNEAVEAYEKDSAEMESLEAELVEKFANEPRVMVLRADGVPILTDVPASMVVPMPDRTPEEDVALLESGFTPPTSAGRIVLPPGVEQ